MKANVGITVENSKLETLPILLMQLPPYSPNLPHLLQQVVITLERESTTEQRARRILAEVAEYYSQFFEYYFAASEKANKLEIISNIYRAHMWEDIRKQMYATRTLATDTHDLVSVEKLYTIFERC